MSHPVEVTPAMAAAAAELRKAYAALRNNPRNFQKLIAAITNAENISSREEAKAILESLKIKSPPNN